MEAEVSPEELLEEISCIVYRRDVFEYGDQADISRHIDIEFDYGDFHEIPEEAPLFPFICGLSGLSGEEEIPLYGA